MKLKTGGDLRHTFGSRLAMADVPIRHIADLTAHATIQMTMKYAHLSPESKLDAIKKLDKYPKFQKSTESKTESDENDDSKNNSKSFVLNNMGR